MTTNADLAGAIGAQITATLEDLAAKSLALHRGQRSVASLRRGIETLSTLIAAYEAVASPGGATRPKRRQT